MPVRYNAGLAASNSVTINVMVPSTNGLLARWPFEVGGRPRAMAGA